jgi:hypothetical protein
MVGMTHTLDLDDDLDPITREWELARRRATTPAELAEIDAIFGRYAA